MEIGSRGHRARAFDTPQDGHPHELICYS